MTANEETNEERQSNGDAGERAGEANAEVPADEPATETGEPASEEAPPEEIAEAASEPASEQPAAETAAPAGADEEEPLTAKQRRKLERSHSTGPPGSQRSPADRAGERAALRGRKAADRSRWRASRQKRDRSKPVRPAGEAPVREERAKGAQKQRQGVVVSNKADKTITVRIDLVRSHRVYGKVVHETSTLHAHDEGNQAGEGDVVRVVECRPLSRSKRWRLVEILEKAR